MWEVVIHPGVLGDLRRGRTDPLDRITLRERLRGLRRMLLATRGRPPHTAGVDHLVPGGVRVVFDRLDCIFTLHPTRRRSGR